MQSLIVILLTFNVAVGVRVFKAAAAQEKDDSGYSNFAVFARALQHPRHRPRDEQERDAPGRRLHRSLVPDGAGHEEECSEHGRFHDWRGVRTVRDTKEI